MSVPPIVQYIVVRKDLAWPAGALIAQACHASTAAVHRFYEHSDTKEYLGDLPNMHKIVLQIPTEETMKSLADKLEVASIDHQLWIEQPENIPTCLALRPYRKDVVQSFFKGLKLFQ